MIMLEKYFTKVLLDSIMIVCIKFRTGMISEKLLLKKYSLN